MIKSIMIKSSVSLSLVITLLMTQTAFSQNLNVNPQLPALVLPQNQHENTDNDLTEPLPFSAFPTTPYIEEDTLIIKAKLANDSPEIEQGLTWRVFSPDPAEDGRLPLLATLRGGTGRFSLPAGSYLVHVAFGRAGATKRITLKGEVKEEEIVLDAGGLKLNAELPDNGELIKSQLSFSIYNSEDDGSETEKNLILPNVEPDKIIRLNSGRYHIVSNYGSANAIIRADARVEPGKLTELTVQHSAAQITLKLVREKGGEALADTSWSVLNGSGDIVRETVGAYNSVILTDGDYVAIAKNKDRIYQLEFKVESGKNTEVEVVATSENEVPENNDAATDENG